MTREEIERHLRTSVFGRTIFAFDALDSTNSFAKSLVQQGAEEGTVVIAEEQYAGRGRFGRRWHSMPGKNLTFSLVIRPEISPKVIGLLSLYAGLAVAETLERHVSVMPFCKWPNDVMIDGKKICGILSEAVISSGRLEAAIIGIGVNINQTEFSPTITKPTTSLADVAGTTFDRSLILAELLLGLELQYDLIQKRKYQTLVDRWLERTNMLGQEVVIDQDGELIKGITKSMADDGGLILTTEGGDRKFLAGDVTIIQ